MSVRRRTTNIIAYLIIMVLGMVAIVLPILGLRRCDSFLAIAIPLAIGPGTVITGIYAWARGLGGRIGSDTTTAFYFRWWDFLVIIGIYIVSIALLIFLILLFMSGGRY